MTNKKLCNKLTLLLLVVVLTVAAGTAAFSASWSSFSDAIFTGITASPVFATNVVTYNLSVGAAPMITIGSNTYSVVWVQGFYALSSDGVGTFYAGGSDITIGGLTWKWDTSPNISSPNNYVVAGWSAQGSAPRLTPGNNKSFSYSAFQIPQNNSVILGLHVGYLDSGTQQNVTAFFKPENPVVPEASASLLGGIGAPLVGIMAFARRRFGRTK